MIRNSNGQNVFILVKKLAIQLFGADRVFDEGLPPEGTPYPFVYIANQDTNRYPTKDNSIENVNQMVRIYHNDTENRGTLDSMLYALRIEAGMQRFLINNSSIRLNDYSTVINPEEGEGNGKLLHGVLTLSFIANDTTLN